MEVAVNLELKTLNVKQKITFYNNSKDTLDFIILNDWNNAFSGKNSPLAKRFSDEFYRGFHLAKADERGNTTILNLEDYDNRALEWERTEKNPDLINVKLNRQLYPGEKFELNLTYISKIPSEKFTHYGYTQNGGMNLKNWFLSPARFENGSFIDMISALKIYLNIEVKKITPQFIFQFNHMLKSVFQNVNDFSITCEIINKLIAK